MLFFVTLITSFALLNAEVQDDQLDIDHIINTPSELQDYVDCFLDRKPCTPLAESYKENIEDAVKTACSKCTSDQKETFLKFIIAVQENMPSETEAFKAKYDPDGIYYEPLQIALTRV